MTIGPVSSGLDEASIMAAQPPMMLASSSPEDTGHHGRPAALAIADDGGLGGVRMQLAHAAHELALGGAHVHKRLARLRLGEEDDEIHRMAFAQRHADLRVVLEAADAGAMAGARI